MEVQSLNDNADSNEKYALEFPTSKVKVLGFDYDIAEVLLKGEIARKAAKERYERKQARHAKFESKPFKALANLKLAA
jgi:hypothetical protein